MSWNYRVCRYPQGGLGLHEVFHDEAGAVKNWTAEPISFVVDEDEGRDRLIKEPRTR